MSLQRALCDQRHSLLDWYLTDRQEAKLKLDLFHCRKCGCFVRSTSGFPQKKPWSVDKTSIV